MKTRLVRDRKAAALIESLIALTLFAAVVLASLLRVLTYTSVCRVQGGRRRGGEKGGEMPGTAEWD